MIASNERHYAIFELIFDRMNSSTDTKCKQFMTGYLNVCLFDMLVILKMTHNEKVFKLVVNKIPLVYEESLEESLTLLGLMKLHNNIFDENDIALVQAKIVEHEQKDK
jgi:hypothetical protein